VQFQDYYGILGVDRSASQDEIKKAYRNLSKQYHPDRNKDDGAEEKFKQVGEAYQVLGDAEARRKYDAIGSGYRQGDPFRPGGGGPSPGWQGVDFNFNGGGFGGQSGPVSGFSDFFEMLFGQQPGGGGGFHAGGAPRGRHGEDREAEITITLENSFHGGSRQITLQTTTTRSDGGRETGRKQYDVKIPPGITTGKKIRLKGQGQPGLGGGKPGDLLLKVTIAPHPHFEVEGSDLKGVLKVAPWEAALGAKVDCRTLDGSVTLTIPKGTQSGQKLRLKGKGLPKGKGHSGDLHVEVRIVTPPASNSELEQLYKDLAAKSKFDPRAD
jgi:curved DNA-binding protein